MNPTIQFTRIRSVKAPNRANKNDAGMDFFVPDYTTEFYKDLVAKNEKNGLGYQTTTDDVPQLEITIPANGQVNIPSGIKVNILDKNTYLDANNKSGVATKYGLIVGAKVVDADYQGEIHLNMINTRNIPVTITTGQKIVQFIHKEFIHTDLQEISNEQYDQIGVSDRGTGGFSSTGER